MREVTLGSESFQINSYTDVLALDANVAHLVVATGCEVIVPLFDSVDKIVQLATQLPEAAMYLVCHGYTTLAPLFDSVEKMLQLARTSPEAANRLICYSYERKVPLFTSAESILQFAAASPRAAESLMAYGKNDIAKFFDTYALVSDLAERSPKAAFWLVHLGRNDNGGNRIADLFDTVEKVLAFAEKAPLAADTLVALGGDKIAGLFSSADQIVLLSQCALDAAYRVLVHHWDQFANDPGCQEVLARAAMVALERSRKMQAQQARQETEGDDVLEEKHRNAEEKKFPNFFAKKQLFEAARATTDDQCATNSGGMGLGLRGDQQQ